jgi:hypothetical protein
VSDKIRYLKDEYQHQAEAIHQAEASDRKGGGGPPGGSELETRVAALEKISAEMRDKLGGIEITLARMETTLDGFKTNVFPNLTTKADLANETGLINQSVANFRTEITRVEGSMIKWFIATAVLLSGGVGAIAFGLARAISH